MLDLDLDLEADLGVDTVKQAEMFAAIARPTTFRAMDLKLRDFPTLAHVIGFVLRSARSGDAAPHRGTAAVGAAGRMPAPSGRRPRDAIKEKVLDIVAEKTGYPAEMLDLDLDLEADLGVDTVKQAEMFAAVRESTIFRAMRISSCGIFQRWRR